jgi:hypothetical protein
MDATHYHSSIQKQAANIKLRKARDVTAVSNFVRELID